MNGNGKPYDIIGFTVDVVATLNSQQLPAVLFKDLGKVLARKGFHTTISTI